MGANARLRSANESFESRQLASRIAALCAHLNLSDLTWRSSNTIAASVVEMSIFSNLIAARDGASKTRNEVASIEMVSRV